MDGMVRQVRHAVLEQLDAEGVRHVFGNPGTTEQPFIDALAGASRLEYVMCLNEASVIAAADGYARCTGLPAFAQLHIAAGLGNAIGMLSNARAGRTPLVVYVGQSPSHALFREPHLFGDLVGMADPVTKWAYEVRHSDDVLPALRRAFKVASTPPQGPVVVAIPTDILDETTAVPAMPSPRIDWRTKPAAKAVTAAAQALISAVSPLFVVGDRLALRYPASGETVDQDGPAAATRLAEMLGAPIYQVYPSVQSISVDTPLYAGSLAFTDSRAQRDAYRGADVILCVGCQPEYIVLPDVDPPFSSTTTIVHIDDDAWQLGRDHSRTIALLGPSREVLCALLEEVARLQTDSGRVSASSRAASVKSLIAKRRPTVPDARSPDAALTPDTLVLAIIAAIPSDALLLDDSATMSPLLFSHIGQLRPSSYLKARGGGLGAGIPGAVGVALAVPGRRIVAVVSDGSALFTIVGLWTAAHHSLAITYIIVNNREYQAIKRNMAAYLGVVPDRVVGADLREPCIDFVSLARGLGVDACRVETPATLSEALESSYGQSGPMLVEALTVADKSAFASTGGGHV